MPTTKLPVPGLQSSPVCLWTQPSDCGRKPNNTVWKESYVSEGTKTKKKTKNTFTLLNVGKSSHFTHLRQWTKEKVRGASQECYNFKTNMIIQL